MNKERFPQPVFVCAGELSGDLYAALFTSTIEHSDSALCWYGVGGPHMQAAGIRIVYGTSTLETFGFKAGFQTVPRHCTMLRNIKKCMRAIRPRTFIAVAYPGINLFLLSYARRLGCRVYYLSPPQAWAWGSFRVNLVARWVDTVISTLPFEYEFYRKHRVPVQYWENPLRDEVQQFERTDTNSRIGFMPGSRSREITRNLPIIVEYISFLRTRLKGVKLAIIFPTSEIINRNTWIHNFVQDCINKNPDVCTVYTKNRYQVMKNCDFLVTCSGTASLEAAFMQIPQIFFNHCTWFDYTFIRPLLAIKEYNLANLYYQRQIVPACVSHSSRTIMKFLKRADILQYI